jgi:hypothetical protein
MKGWLIILLVNALFWTALWQIATAIAQWSTP